MAYVQILVGLMLLGVGGELLVRGAAGLAEALRISPLVIGLTVVSFGTSAPELAVSVQSAFSQSADIGLGNVIGSNILNVLLILGLSALVAPLEVSNRLIRRDVPIMIAASILLLVLGLDGRIGRVDGLLLCTGLLTYLYCCIRFTGSPKMTAAERYAPRLEPRGIAKNMAVLPVMIIAGLVLLTIGADRLVEGAVVIATALGVSQLVIGLTVVATGTSLPEVVTSVMAAARGQRDIAVGNVVGSNLFNIMCVLGITSAIAPNGIQVSETALAFDLPVMIAVAIACLPIFFSGSGIARWEGGLFLFYYLAYTTYLVLDAIGSDYQRSLVGVMFGFVIPLTVVTLLVTVWRTALANRRRDAGGPG